MTWRTVIILAWAAPLTAGAFGMFEENNQTHPGPGGAYGIYQSIHHSTTLPGPVVSTWVCSGASAVLVHSIDYRTDDPKMTGLRQLWALANYRTNSLPTGWRPEKAPPAMPDVNKFLGFTAGTQGFSISGFIERYGLPSRYLTGKWDEGQVAAIAGGMPVADETRSLQGPDFLIYDLPSGHAVALYVPKPPASNFATAIIIDAKGDLLVPNMVELLLPAPRKRAALPRRITADSDGTVTAPDANGRKELLGTWTRRDHELMITTLGANRDTFPANQTVWFGGVEYAVDILINEHEAICNPIYGGTRTPATPK